MHCYLPISVPLFCSPYLSLSFVRFTEHSMMYNYPHPWNANIATTLFANRWNASLNIATPAAFSISNQQKCFQLRQIDATTVTYLLHAVEYRIKLLLPRV